METMPIILHINVANKIATYQKRDGAIICGNSDYQVKFTFDEEWGAHTKKVARFIWGGQYFDVEFSGDTCDVPIIQDTEEVEVGVYAGDLKTTTGASIGCKRSILCGGHAPNPGTGQHYSNEAKAAAEAAKASETAAKQSETSAKASEDVAVEAAHTATAKAQAAATSADASATSASEARIAEEAARASAASVLSSAAQIERNSKRITNLEQGLTPDPFITDGSTAYTKTVPENALPFAEVSKIGGVTRRCRNAIPFPYYATATTVSGITFTPQADGGVRVAGTATANASFTLQNSIALKATTYTITHCPGIIIGLDASIGSVWQKTIGYANGGHKTFSLTKEDVDTYRINLFARVPAGGTVDTVIYPMLAEGSMAQPYEPYFTGLRDVKVTEVKSTGEGLEDAIQIPEVVRTKEGYGRGVSEAYHSHISWEDEDGTLVANLVTYSYALLTLTGNESWSLVGSASASNLRFGYQTSYSNAVTRGATSSHYDSITGSIAESYAFGSGFLIHGGGWLEFVDRRFTTVAEWKAYLAAQSAAGTPVQVLLIKSANAQTLDISDQVPLDNMVKVKGGGTITAVNEYGLPAPTEVTYQIKGGAA